MAATNRFGLNPEPYLVLCAVENEQDLADLHARLSDSGVPAVAYREPDFGDQLTAIATQPLSGVARKYLRRLPLLKN